MGFQTQVNVTPAPAVAGDFASANPRASVLAGSGAFVADTAGVTVGKFAWIDPNGTVVHSYGTLPNQPNGFVHREQQALIPPFLGESTMVIPTGLPVTLHNQGDFWAKLTGATSVVRGSALYVDFSSGDIMAAATAGATATGSMGSTNTASLGATFTGSVGISPTLLVVTAVTGYISVGDYVSGTGISAGTTVVSQSSGTTGGAGTYVLSASNTASSATITSFGSVLDVTVTGAGLISVGETVSGATGFPVGATILSQISGTAGGAGLYQLSAAGSAYTASAAGVTTYGNVLNVTAIGSGTLEIGDPVSGTGIPTNATLASQVTGTAGGIGVYTVTVNASAYAASTALTITTSVALTSFKAASTAAPGELVQISSWS